MRKRIGEAAQIAAVVPFTIGGFQLADWVGWLALAVGLFTVGVIVELDNGED